MLEIYLARDLTFGQSCPDDAEHLVVKRMPLEEAIEFAHADNRVSGSTIVGLYRTKELLEKEGVL